MLSRILWYWLQLQRNQWLPISQLEKLQYKKLKAVITHAYEKVPFYRRFYDEHGVNPDNLKSLDDIKKFPSISKELARDIPLEDRTSSRVDVTQCTLKTTSGSTGIPVRVLEDGRSSDYYDAYMLRRLFEYGYKPWYNIVRLETERQRDLDHYGDARDGLSKKFRGRRVNKLIVYDDIDKHLDILKKTNANFILAPPSYLKTIAKTIQERGIPNIRPKVLMTWGEVLDEGTRTFLNSSLGSEVYDGYGCIEIAPLGMAWECKERKGLHINSDVVLLEFLKDGEPVSPGEKGEVFATSLYRFATPMIRYRVGDIVTLSNETCPCGREMPLIKNVEGRKVDFLKMSDGRLVSPYAIMFAIHSIPGIGKYQIIQENKNKIVAKIERGKEFNNNTLLQLRQTAIEIFGSETNFDVNVIEKFQIERGRKFKAVETRL